MILLSGLRAVQGPSLLEVRALFPAEPIMMINRVADLADEDLIRGEVAVEEPACIRTGTRRRDTLLTPLALPLVLALRWLCRRCDTC